MMTTYANKMLGNAGRVAVKTKGRLRARPAAPLMNWPYYRHTGEPVPLREGLAKLRTELNRAGSGYLPPALKAVGNDLAAVVVVLDDVIDHPALDALDPEDEEAVRGLAATWHGSAGELRHEFHDFRPHGRKSFDAADVPMVRDALTIIAAEMTYVLGELDKVSESVSDEDQ